MENKIESGNELLRMEGITKIYPNGFAANKEVDFCVNKGEIHALCGENGAGKSTLMKVLFGEETPDSGQIYLRGEPVKIDSPANAIKLGIGMVHQHFMLVPSLTVAENMTLGIEPRKFGLMSFEKAIAMTNEISQKYGLPIDPRAKIQDLSVGMRQRVEILKILLRGVEILILDEPTAVLTPQETEEIFRELLHLKKLGHTVIFISHKLGEIKAICDRVTIMRDGKSVAIRNVADVSEQDISRLMVGRDVLLKIEKEDAKPGKTVLSVRNLSYRDITGKSILSDVSFDVRQGEILGVAGIEGNGQNELSELLTGLRKIVAGSVVINNNNIEKYTVQQIRDSGVGIVHQDRMIHGVSGEQSIAENIIANRVHLPEFGRGPLLNIRKVGKLADELIDIYQIKCDDNEQPVRMLSGGNIQKVVVAREFSMDPGLVIVNQPTRGIDVGAAELVRKKLIELRDKGAAILLISADLTEIMDMSDSIIVMREGRISAYIKDAKSVKIETLGEYMLGLKTMSSEEIRGGIHEQ